jgi:lysyl-tRNA synthetase, class II
MAIEEIRQVRENKLQKIKDKGLDPYPARSMRTHSNTEVTRDFDTLVSNNTKVTIAGRVMSLRGQGAIIFLDLFDGESRFQGLFKKDDTNTELFGFFNDVVDIGDFIEISGGLFLTKTEQKTVQIEDFRMLSKSLLPLPEKWKGIQDEEDKLRKRYLDILMNVELADRFRKRSKFWNVIRAYLLEKNFIEVETPVLENTTGGADARPFATHHNALDIDVYLRISCGELWQKRLMVAGLPRTFEIGRIFRNEGISPEHAQDYTQLEYYMAYADYNIGMEMTKELYRKIATEVFGTTSFTIRGHEVDFLKEWEMYDFCKIIKDNFGIDPLDETVTNDMLSAKLKEAKIAFDPKELNLSRGVDMLWKSVRKTIAGPGFLVGVPAYLEPLAKRSESNTEVVERFQVILAGSEMGKGFSELNDPVDQKERFINQQKMRDAGDDEAQMADFEYVEAMEHGMPPTFGFGLSERLFSFLLDVPIREAQLFPLMKPKGGDSLEA